VQLLVGCGASRLSKRGYSASDLFKEEPVGTVRQIVEASEPDGSLSPIAAWLDRTAKWPAFRVVRTPLPTTRRARNLWVGGRTGRRLDTNSAARDVGVLYQPAQCTFGLLAAVDTVQRLLLHCTTTCHSTHHVSLYHHVSQYPPRVTVPRRYLAADCVTVCMQTAAGPAT
jgi:hypothetical protein